MRSKKPKLVKLVGAVSPATSLSMSGDHDSVSATEAARKLNISSRSFRRLAEAGKIPTFRTPGGYVRVRRLDLDAFKSLSSSIVPAIPSRVDSAREENQMLSLELQHKKLRRDLRRVDEEDAEAERKRAAAVAAEQARSEAARIIVALTERQRSLGIGGGAAEIGVHHGKLFILLYLLCQASEKAVAIDLFEDQHLNIDHSGSGDLAKFRGNLERHADSTRLVLHQGNSMDLSGAILTRLQQRALTDRQSWTRLRRASIVSASLWLLTTLLGAALPNIG